MENDSQTGQKNSLKLTVGGEDVEFNIVDADERHRSFIIATWVRSYMGDCKKMFVSSCSYPVFTSADCYHFGESKLAERFWSNAKVLVSGEDSYTVYGWVVANGSCLLHVYVPPEFRRRGLGRRLVEEALGTSYAVWKPMKHSWGHKQTWNPWGVL